MKVGDFISFTDRIGKVLGRVKEVQSKDTCYIQIITASLTEYKDIVYEWKYYKDNENTIYEYDLTRVSDIKIYENYEEFIQENFVALL